MQEKGGVFEMNEEVALEESAVLITVRIKQNEKISDLLHFLISNDFEFEAEG